MSTSDHERALLRWLWAQDLPDRVVLLCRHLAGVRVPRRGVGVRLEGCVDEVGTGLPAQLLALGVPHLSVVSCDLHPEECTTLVRRLQELFPDQVDVLPATRASRWARHGTVVDIAAVPLPRRLVLGMGLRDRAPLDLGGDSARRTLAALDILASSGRARLPGTERRDAAPSQDRPRRSTPSVRVDPVAVPPLTPPVEVASTEASGVLIGMDLVARGCTACGVCVRACPTGALRLDVDGGTSTLTHLRSDCRADLHCVELCPVDALAPVAPADASSVLERPEEVLATVATSACTRCGTAHPASEGDLCPVCAFRASASFGSQLPPAVLARLRDGQDTAS